MLPEKTIERLSMYRRVLTVHQEKGNDFIYSHELASILHLTAVQIRRDVMLIGYTGTQRKGYLITDLIQKISEILDDEVSVNAIIIGMGHLGKAISNYFNSNRSNIKIIAAFDKDQTKVDRIISGIKSYHIENLNKIIKSDNCKIAILSMSPKDAQNVADALIYNGIKGIMNFTSVPLNVPETVYVENYDMITSIEKVAYYVKKN